MNIIELKNFLNNELPKLSPRQVYKTKTLELEDTIRYLKSIKGLYKRKIYYVNKETRPSEIFKANRYFYMADALIRPDRSHKPMNSSKTSWYGVEIECLFPSETRQCRSCHGEGCEDCEDTGQIADGDKTYNFIGDALSRALKLKRVNFKSDGSIREQSGFIGVEFNVLCSKIDDFKNLRQLCAWLNEIGAKVNKSCGLHVHLDQRNVTKSDINRRFSNLTKCVKAMAEIVPESRKNNTYCQLRGSMTERYSAVNGTALKKYNTIEIRLHSSTTEFNKIRNWIELLDLIQKAPKKAIVSSVNTLEDLFMVLDIHESLIEYCLSRRDKFMAKIDSEETNDSPILASILAA